MPTTLTLKGIPDDLYARLKDAAEAHRRSLNNETIAILETALMPLTVTRSERIARARAVRARLKGKFAPKDIDRAKRRNRP